MTGETHYRKLEQMYLAAPCNAYYNPQVSIEKGTAEIVIPVRENLFHAAGAVHGSAYFKALDDSAFFSAQSLVDDVFVLTANFNLYLLRPVVTGEIRAVGKVVSQSKRQIIAESIAYDSDDREIARGSGTFVLGKTLLTDIGY